MYKEVFFNYYINRLEQNKNDKEKVYSSRKLELILYKRYKIKYGYLGDLRKIINIYNLNISFNMTFNKFINNESLNDEEFNFNRFYTDFRSVELALISNNNIKDAFYDLNQILKNVGYEYDPELNYSNFVEGRISFNSFKHKDVLSVKSDKPNGTIVKLVYGGIIHKKSKQFVFKSEVYVSLNL